MNVGFTGTREGMTQAQRQQFVHVLDQALERERVDEFHYGGCVGADAQAAALARWIGFAAVLHPANDVAARWIAPKPEWTVRVRPARPALDRNRDIVDACDLLIVAPRLMREERRSGTWQTVRFAERIGHDYLIVWPDGTMETHNEKRGER